MKVHHLNCGTMRPRGVAGGLVAHCLLIETAQGLILVDTGFGMNEVLNPKETINAVTRSLTRPMLDVNETAVSQIERRGYVPEDVKHILLTHLDMDHAGGLRDFPSATVHVLDSELEAATNPPTTREKMRYPAVQREGVRFETHSASGEPWFGFESVRDIPDIPEEILLVPLIGHTRGHTGVAVKDGDRWLLHAGDAYFFRGEVETPPHDKFALKFFAGQVETLHADRVSNVERLRELKASGEAEVFSAHDPVEFARLA